MTAVDTLPWSFARFEPGAPLGSTALVVDHQMMTRWEALFGPVRSEAEMPMGAVPLLLMQAFANVVLPRPPGNLHVAQQCSLHCLPTVGQRLIGRVACHGKELRKDRRVVQFATEIADAQDDTCLISGLTTIFWAL